MSARFTNSGSGQKSIVSITSSGKIIFNLGPHVPTASLPTADIPSASWYNGVYNSVSNRFIVVGSGYSAYSSDGLTWIPGNLSGDWPGIASSPLGPYSNFTLTVGFAGVPVALYSTNGGALWNTAGNISSLDPGVFWYSVVICPARGFAVAVGSFGTVNSAWYQPYGGGFWFTPTNPGTGPATTLYQVDNFTQWCSVAYSASTNTIVAVGLSGGTYSSAYVPVGTYSFSGTNLYSPGRDWWDGYDPAFVAAGPSNFVAMNANGYTATSTNGSSWTTGTNYGPATVSGGTAWSGLAYSASIGGFLAVAQNGIVAKSTDGSTWSLYIDVSSLTGTNIYGSLPGSNSITTGPNYTAIILNGQNQSPQVIKLA